MSRLIRGVNLKKLIRVPDTLNALNNLAKVTRHRTKAKIIGITGSSGKTTLKDMTSFVLKLPHQSRRSIINMDYP